MAGEKAAGPPRKPLRPAAQPTGGARQAMGGRRGSRHRSPRARIRTVCPGCSSSGSLGDPHVGSTPGGQWVQIPLWTPLHIVCGRTGASSQEPPRCRQLSREGTPHRIGPSLEARLKALQGGAGVGRGRLGPVEPRRGAPSPARRHIWPGSPRYGGSSTRTSPSEAPVLLEGSSERPPGAIILEPPRPVVRTPLSYRLGGRNSQIHLPDMVTAHRDVLASSSCLGRPRPV